MCIPVTVCDHPVETGTLGTLMGALVMLNVLDLIIVDRLSYWPRAVKSLGKITVTALRRPTVRGIETSESTDVIHGRVSLVSSFILERWRVDGRKYRLLSTIL